MIENLESFWDELLAYVEARSVIPIVGTGLAIIGSSVNHAFHA